MPAAADHAHNSAPSVTVIIPCFNHGRFVRHAVLSCLRQTQGDIRVIIVNDGSTDPHTPAACDACSTLRKPDGSPANIRVIHQDNKGLPAARNAGAAHADSTYLVFLDADDWIEPDFVAKLHARITAESHDNAAVSHAYCFERLVELGTGIWRTPEWDPILLMITNLHPVTALVRTDRFHAVGGFTESMRHGYEDWDFWLKFAHRGWRGVRVPEPLFVWRRHSPSTMVMQVIHQHETLYRSIILNHKPLFDAHWPDALLRANVLMRRFDVNWLDESGYPIPLQALWKLRDDMDRLPFVRLSRWLTRTIDRLPRPLFLATRSLSRTASRLIHRSH